MKVLLEEKEADVAAAAEMDQLEAELRGEARSLLAEVRALEVRAANIQNAIKAEALTHIEVEGALEDISEDIYTCRLGLYRMVSRALDGRYSTGEVKAWCDRAIEMGATHPQFDPGRIVADLVRVRKVPNAPFRERLVQVLDVEGEEGISDVTLLTYRHLRAIEKEHGREYGAKSLVVLRDEDTREGIPQTRELERWLGLATKSNGATQSLRLFVSYEQATALARALDMTPQEAGI